MQRYKNLNISLCVLAIIFTSILTVKAESSKKTHLRKIRQGEEEQKIKAEQKKNEAIRSTQEGNKAFLKERLEKNKALTEVQKKELVDYFEGQYPGKVSVKDKQNAKDREAFEKIASDQRMNQFQKKTAIKKYLEAKNKSKEKNEVQKEISLKEVKKEEVKATVDAKKQESKSPVRW